MNTFNDLRKIICVALVSVLFFACGKSGGGDYSNALPADAMLVLSVNNYSIKKKADAEDIAKTPLYDRLVSIISMSGLDDKDQDYILSIVRDPDNSGLDQKENTYLFMNILPGSSQYNPMFGGGVLMKMKNVDKFEKMISFLGQQAGEELVPLKGGELNTIEIPMGYGGAVVAYNKDLCLLYFDQQNYDNAVAKVNLLATQKKDQSLMKVNEANSALSKSNDYACYMAFESFADLSNDPVLSYMRGLSMVFTGNFEKGKIDNDFKVIYGSKETKQEIERLSEANQKQKGDLLKYIPREHIFTIGGGVKGNKLYETLVAIPQFAMIAFVPQVKQVLDMIDGDMVISMSGMTPGYGGIPKGSVIFSTAKNSKVLETLSGQLSSMPLEKTADGYSIDLYGTNIYMGENNDLVYITTDPEVKSAIEGNKISSLADAKTNFKGSMGTVSINFSNLTNLLEVMNSNNPYSRSRMEPVISVLGMFESIEMYDTSDTTGKIEVFMKDQSQNAAKTIYQNLSALIEANIADMLY